MDLKRVVITGVGARSALGSGYLEHQDSFLSAEVKAFTVPEFQNWPAAGQNGFVMSGEKQNIVDIIEQTGKEAVESSGVHPDHIICGVGFSQISAQQIYSMAGKTQPDEIQKHLQTHQVDYEDFGKLSCDFKNSFDVRTTIVSTACSGGTQAIGMGYKRIRRGHGKKILVGAGDSFRSEIVLAGFMRLGVVSNEKCRPFDKERNGFTPGEGSVFFMLEEYGHAKKRGANIFAEVSGYGESNNAYRITDTPPNGSGAVLAMSHALKDGKLNAEEINHINAHGTGTVQNDLSESRAIEQVYNRDIFVSSTKSLHGHLIGAAGSIEAFMAVLSLKNNVIPKINNFKSSDCSEVLRFACEQIEDTDMKYVMSNSFGFGGGNASLILKSV